MKSRQDILDHVTVATGVGPDEAGRVIEAAFAFLRDSALAGDDVAHPSLGRIRVRARDDGKTVCRYVPRPGAGAGKGGAGKGARGKGGGKGGGGKAGARRRGGKTGGGGAGTAT